MSDNQSIEQSYKKRNLPAYLYHPITGRRVPQQYLRYLKDEHEPTHNRLVKRVKALTETINVSFQGEVIHTRHNGVPDRPQMGSGRQSISEFSSKARKNMLDTVSRMDWTIPATFITLTYHENMMDANRAKRDLRAVLKRWYRRYGNIPCLWKLEPQKRGAWHFHLICFNMPYLPLKEVLDDWREVTGDNSITQVKIEPIQSARKARSYCAKYLAKPISDGFLNWFALILLKCPSWLVFRLSLDYLPNLAVNSSPGRFWGIENRKNVIWATLTEFSITRNEAYYNFKRAARRKWAGVNSGEHSGFTLYSQDINRWIDYLFYLMGDYRPPYEEIEPCVKTAIKNGILG